MALGRELLRKVATAFLALVISRALLGVWHTFGWYPELLLAALIDSPPEYALWIVVIAVATVLWGLVEWVMWRYRATQENLCTQRPNSIAAERDTGPPPESYISMIVCGPPMVCATALLNGNSVPAVAEAEIHAAARRLGIFLHHVKTVPIELELVRNDFHTHLKRNWEPYVAAAKRRNDIELVAFSDGLVYLARLHAVLYELKAFLDLFSRLICRLVSTQPGPHGFHQGKVDGCKLSGGRLINWLKNHPIETLPNRDLIVQTLSKASREWITDAVATRDTLAHFRDLPGFRHMRISVSHGGSQIAVEDIIAPELPDGRELTTYTVELRDRLCRLVSVVLPLAPEVKGELNEDWDSAMRYLNE